MQLTEIVQLVLVSFSLLIIVIFFVSYISYKTKKKSNIILVSDIENHTEEMEQTQNLDTAKNDFNKSSDRKILNPKFQVFNPKTSSENVVNTNVPKKHFPRTLSIKF